MRWYLTGVIAAVLALAVSETAGACGCGCGAGCCAGPVAPGGDRLPGCAACAAGNGPAAGQPSTSGLYRYWDGASGGYLFYHPATRASYYWSEPQRRYLPVSNPPAQGRGLLGAAPAAVRPSPGRGAQSDAGASAGPVLRRTQYSAP